ncbi:hypothetical protein GT347_20255 [Xylophilus rhododendri]|uniref:Uncharacterized protein n=1 Tax=Xylophilus rhododendri TaxID=2697032 RepID=A0A857JBM4_9BURK|nr:hypothetical protein [Xylophilus rhododendri]QHJ00106.1 hypothetical protein GT347_20255 [Xylophilus rhododendri]
MPKRQDGMLQCNRCGCRTSLTTTNGTYFKDGRRINGTVIEKDVCANCFKDGIKSSMLPTIKPA